MRWLVGAALAATLAACAANGTPPQDIGATENSPFPVARGTLAAPPLSEGGAGGGAAAPPEGRAPGGVDFGQWRSADPTVYAAALQAQMRQRYAGRNAAEIRADLEANGFGCASTGLLQCRIEIFERQCAHDWYVVVERAQAEPIAGYDVMCLGAR